MIYTGMTYSQGKRHHIVARPPLPPLPKGGRRYATLRVAVWQPLSLIAVCILASTAIAGEPSIRNLSLRGVEIGAATSIVVDGDELGTAPRLLLPFSATQQLKPGSTDKQATFEIVSEANVVAGLYQLRVVTDGGVSLPVIVAVDKLPQRPLAAAIEKLPAAVHGTVGGSAVVEMTFVGQAGQKVLLEVDAQRLGSKLRPIVHLYNSKRRQLGWSWGIPALSGDARLEVTLPADDKYTVAIHDAEYSPPGPGYFQLRIGQWSYVDQVFPPVVAVGQAHGLELIGLSPATRADLPVQTAAGTVPLPWPGEGLWSGPRPFVAVSSHAEVIEQPAAGGLQELPTGLVGVSGRLLTSYEEDRYKIPVVPGSKLRLEAFAERLGSPLDTAIVVRNEAGDLLARGEDSAGMIDPVLEYAVPATVNYVVAGVIDAQGRGSPRGVYRLVIDPQTPGLARRDFKLSTPAQRVSLPVGGRWVLPVYLDRQGYPGGIELAANSIPPGVRIEGSAIPEGADGTLLTVERGEASFEASITGWHGRAADGFSQPVAVTGHPLAHLQPWLASEIALAPATAKASDFQIDWRGLPSDAGVVPSVRLALPVKLVRPAGTEAVRLTLLTSQPPLSFNGPQAPDPNRILRAEKPVELAGNALEADFGVLVPPELPAPVYDMTIQAELLTADKQRVQATAFAPVRRMNVRMPVVVQLAGPAQIEVSVEPNKGTTVMIAGKIERREGLTGDVVVTLAGLPAGASAAAVTVKADATDFSINLVLPANVPMGEIKGFKLSANAAAPGNAAQRVRSRDVELVLLVKPK